LLPLVLGVLILSNAQTAGPGFEAEFKPVDANGAANATAAAGFVDVSFNFIDSPLIDIVWCGEKKNVIFVLTEKSSVYRSEDDGFSGHKLTEHLDKLGKKELGTAKGDVRLLINFSYSCVGRRSCQNYSKPC
jgi:hypothetical protein